MPWFYYLVNLPLTAAPWTIVGSIGLLWPFITRRRADRRLLFPLLWLGLGVLIFSLTPMKKNAYLLPFMPAQTLLIAAPIVAMLRPYATNDAHDPASRALLNWHAIVAVGAVAVMAYFVAQQLVDMSDFGMAFPICGALAAGGREHHVSSHGGASTDAAAALRNHRGALRRFTSRDCRMDRAAP
jgi:4-amino-4-deoxy-L-arabinose transferase-like glycosyltransferase